MDTEHHRKESLDFLRSVGEDTLDEISTHEDLLHLHPLGLGHAIHLIESSDERREEFSADVVSGSYADS